MSKLAIGQIDPNLLVNGYVAFDPLRWFLVKKGKLPSTDDPFEVMKEALERNGFAGVKIYPPMGFQAFGNAMRPNKFFGKYANSWLGLPSNGHELGEGINAALDQVYRYCLRNHVPILAHSANSQASFPGIAKGTAAPEWWQALLDRTDGGTDGNFSDLRVNLGHFGSIWCHDHDVVPHAPNDDDSRCMDALSWTDKILDFAATGKYPNLYFDISDLGDVTSSETAIDRLVAFLNRQEPERSALMSHLLYGTDWVFLVTFGQTHVNYVAAIDRLIMNLARRGWTGAEAAIFHENSARFLRLVEGEKTAERLRAFYGDSVLKKSLDRVILPRLVATR